MVYRKNTKFILISILIAGMPALFAACRSAESIPAKERNEVLEMTALTRGLMGSQVMSKAVSMSQEKGPEAAAEFCMQNAAALTESVRMQAENQLKEKYKIKELSFGRASLKNRNPRNFPPEFMIPVLRGWEKEIALGKSGEPEVIRDGDYYYGLQPIVISAPACLKCHGIKGAGLDEKAAAAIQKKYPEDKATGYREGDLRGVFWTKIRY